MSIIIKGLSKSHSCYGCFLVHEQTIEVGYCPLLKREVKNFNERPKDCPIESIDQDFLDAFYGTQIDN